MKPEPTRPFTAWIDFVAGGPDGQRLRAAFGTPLRLLVARRPDEVAAVLNAAEQHALQGRWCVGHVAYEAAAAFDPAFEVHATDEPLAWFAVHEEAWLDADPAQPGTGSDAPAWSLGPWRSPLTEGLFAGQVERIHAAIADGEVYQVNLTAPLRSRLEGDALALFHALCRAQPRGYAAYLDMGDRRLLSVSPELFFDWRQGHIFSRPMKGTAARGDTPESDQALAQALRASPKEQAENLMIVDLIRNDLSRIAEPFSVRVPHLFDVRDWPTVWQMTSDVVARTRPGTRLADVFGALFPCGSVTGAPKVRAMHWIARLEGRPRGAYCGAVGVLQPGGAATFNVAIRTVALQGGDACCGIGSGITADARAAGEWREWHSKQAFLRRCESPFDLLETLRLSHGRYPHLQAHLARMGVAAAHFGHAFDAARARAALESLALDHGTGLWRVRLLCDAWGGVEAKAAAMPPDGDVQGRPPVPVKVRLAERFLPEAGSEFVRFKTTRRGHYDAFAPADPGVFDTLLWNEQGELTEYTRGNVAVLLRGRWLTPAASSGLLQGIGRSLALRAGRMEEARLTRDDLVHAQGLAFINGLRGWLPAELVD